MSLRVTHRFQVFELSKVLLFVMVFASIIACIVMLLLLLPIIGSWGAVLWLYAVTIITSLVALMWSRFSFVATGEGFIISKRKNLYKIPFTSCKSLTLRPNKLGRIIDMYSIDIATIERSFSFTTLEDDPTPVIRSILLQSLEDDRQNIYYLVPVSDPAHGYSIETLHTNDNGEIIVAAPDLANGHERDDLMLVWGSEAEKSLYTLHGNLIPYRETDYITESDGEQSRRKQHIVGSAERGYYIYTAHQYAKKEDGKLIYSIDVL